MTSQIPYTQNASIYRVPEYHNTTAEPSSFEVLNKPKTFYKKVPAAEDIPKGRPLWQMELRKQNPAPTTYEQDNLFGNTKQLLKTQTHTFKHSYASYRRTCDINKGIKIFNGHADIETKGLDYGIQVTHTKRRWPGYSQSKAAQHVLWDEEVRLADMVPGADAYRPTYDTQKPSRFNDTHLGTDVKTCDKQIKFTPGPGHYNNDSTRGRTHNFRARNGPYKAINQLIAVTADQSVDPPPMTNTGATSVNEATPERMTNKSQRLTEAVHPGHFRAKGYPFKEPLQKVDPMSKAPQLRGPMLAGKCLDQFTATDNFMTLPSRTDRVWEKHMASAKTTNKVQRQNLSDRNATDSFSHQQSPMRMGVIPNSSANRLKSNYQVQQSQEQRLKQHQKVYGGKKSFDDGDQAFGTTGTATRYNTNDAEFSSMSVNKQPFGGGPFMIPDNDIFNSGHKGIANSEANSSRMRNDRRRNHKTFATSTQEQQMVLGNLDQNSRFKKKRGSSAQRTYRMPREQMGRSLLSAVPHRANHLNFI